jgi:glycosyltransferase involved in cell wall biosynthesis
MTILQIVPSYKPAYVYGGPIYSISALCEAQAALGHQVFVFTTNANGANNLDVPLRNIQSINKVAVVYFPRITGDHTHISPKLWFKLFKDANKYDIVHLHSWWSVLMIGCAWILKLKGIKFVFSPRGMFSDYSFNHNINPIKKGIFFNLLTKPVLKKQLFHATAPSEEIEIKALFGDESKVFTLPNLLQFPKLSLSSIQSHPKKETINLLFISRIDRKKGIELLLKAIELLKKENLSIHLTIIGLGSDEYIQELKDLASSLKISEIVEWKGSVEWKAKFDDILKSDILVLPSYNENFANIILETLYAGRPVILTKYVGLSDYVDTQKMGWVIDTNPQDIVEAVKEYSIDKPSWHSKSLQMHNQILTDFNQTILAAKYISYYKETLNLN